MDELNAFVSIAEDGDLKNEAKMELKGILLLEKLPENIEAALAFAGDNVNSPSGESSPAFYTDGSLYFTGLNAKIPTVLDGTEGEYHAKIYTTTKTPDGTYSKAVALEEAINRIDFYNTGVSFSGDGQRMYFTRAKFNNNKMETSQIYVSKDKVTSGVLRIQ